MTSTPTERIVALKTLPTTPIQPDDHTAAAAQKLMRQSFIRVLELEVACHDDRNLSAAEQLHREAVRLAVQLQLAAPYLPGKDARRLTKRLRKLIKRGDAVYELDLMMRDLLVYGESVENRMMIAGVVAHLDAQRLAARSRLLKHIEGKKHTRFLDRFEAMLRQKPEDAFDMDAVQPGQPVQLRHLLPLIFHQRLATIRAYEPFFEQADPDMMRALCDQLCELSHLLDSFEAVLGARAVPYLDALLRLRENTGKITEITRTLDRLIHLPRISLDNAQLGALKAYRHDLRTRRERLQDTFPDYWETFNRRQVQEKLSDALLVLR